MPIEEFEFEDAPLKGTGSSGHVWSGKTVIAACVLVAVVVATVSIPMTYFLHPQYAPADEQAPIIHDPIETTPAPREPTSKSTKPPQEVTPSPSITPPTAGPPTIPPTGGPTSTTPTAGPVVPRDPGPVRVDCLPDRDLQGDAYAICLARGCTWNSSYVAGMPWCFFPDDYTTYSVVEETSASWGTRLSVERNALVPSFFNKDVLSLTVDIEPQRNNRLHFKIYDPANARFEVPIDTPMRPDTKAANPNYLVEYTNDPFTIKVTRKDTGQVLWDTSIGALIFEDQFLTISTLLPSTNIYGIGESEHESFRHDLNWHTWGAFSRDQPPSYKANLYGVHPFYMCVENDANAHGVLLLNANAQDYSLQPTPALTYHTIGGVLDFYMFFGPTPEHVIMQYTETIGRPMIPPYWSLGYQLCRYGYNSLDRVQEVVESMRQYDIPHDVQYGDIDYMERQLDFTIDKDDYIGLGDWVQTLKPQGTRYIIILDPAISANETEGTYDPYYLGVEQDVFIKDEFGEDRLGKVWPDYAHVTPDPSLPWDDQVELFRAPAVFPDFRKASTKQWWLDEVTKFHARVDFDGLWIDMNEPASFVHGSTTGCSSDDNSYDYPPFLPHIWGPTIYDKTICMNSVQHVTEGTKGTHYDMHSLYGWSQTEPSLVAAQAATGKRSLVISRSTFPSSGKHGGHWLGDNASIWPHLGRSIIGMLEFNLFGIPYIGADICGFFDDTNEQLCRRWHQVGVFYPYARNHNGLGYIPQHPPAFGEQFALEVRDLLHIRYRMLPFLYTLFYHANTKGATVVRSLMHEFTSDSNTWDVDRQFMWGPALLISPVLEADTTSVQAYFPVARWYDFYTGMEVPSNMLAVGGGVTLDAPLDYVNLHVRGGHIIPVQAPHNSTMFSRLNHFGLIIPLNANYEAHGDLFWDDGESMGTIENGQYYMFKYTFANNILTVDIEHEYAGLMDGLEIGTIHIYGLSEEPSRVVLTDFQTVEDVTFAYNSATKSLDITELGHAMDTQFTLNVIV